MPPRDSWHDAKGAIPLFRSDGHCEPGYKRTIRGVGSCFSFMYRKIAFCFGDSRPKNGPAGVLPNLATDFDGTSDSVGGISYSNIDTM
jgi:hypothetical protein